MVGTELRLGIGEIATVLRAVRVCVLFVWVGVYSGLQRLRLSRLDHRRVFKDSGWSYLDLEEDGYRLALADLSTSFNACSLRWSSLFYEHGQLRAHRRGA